MRRPFITKLYQKPEILKIVVVLFLAAMVLILDLNSPLGIAVGVLYVLPLVVTYSFKHRWMIVLTTCLFSTLILCGLLKHWSLNVPFIMVVTNRIFSLLVIWVMTLFMLLARRKAEIIIQQKENFENLSIELRQQLDVLNAAAIVSIADTYGSIVYVNEMFCKISKYDRKELTGNNHRMLKSGIHPNGLFVGMWKAISSGLIWQGEICNKAKDGSIYWVYTTIAPFFNKDGKIDKYVSVRFDITEVKKQELLLRDQTEKLRQANEELETFSYSVSHDLRSPLRALEGFSKALMENYGGKFDEDGNRWLRFISDNATKMGVLISDILGFSRVSRGNISIQKVNMQLLARENFENERVNYPRKEIIFTLEELHEINGDSQMLRQVWQNLISNALKYSSKKEVVRISITSREENGFCIYCIQDNGDGFDQKYEDKIYGVFQRLHSPQDFDGTGVGLAIVHRILQKHDGWIKGIGKPGEGSEFTFALPKNKI